VENFRFKTRHGAQKVFTKELPNRLGFQLLRSYVESSQQLMDTCEQRFRFIRLGVLRSDGEMLRTAMIAAARHGRE